MALIEILRHEAESARRSTQRALRCVDLGELGWKPATGVSVSAAASRERRRRTRVWFATVILLFTTSSSVYVLATRGPQDHASSNADPQSAVSPDGRFRVQADGEPASQKLLLINVSTGDAAVIHSAPGTTYLEVSFSADGNAVRFRETRAGQPALRYEIPILGGAPRRIADDAPAVAPSVPTPARPLPAFYLAAIFGTALTALLLTHSVVRRLARRRTVAGREASAAVTVPVAPSDVRVNSHGATEFTIWVRDPSQDESYLLALLTRICREHPHDIPSEFKAYADGERSRRLSYRTSPNLGKGGTDVTWILTRLQDPDREAYGSEPRAVVASNSLEQEKGAAQHGAVSARQAELEDAQRRFSKTEVRELVELLVRNPDGADVRLIGHTLHRRGGQSLMLTVHKQASVSLLERTRRESAATLREHGRESDPSACRRAEEAACAQAAEYARLIERAWDGIGEWMG